MEGLEMWLQQHFSCLTLQAYQADVSKCSLAHLMFNVICVILFINYVIYLSFLDNNKFNYHTILVQHFGTPLVMGRSSRSPPSKQLWSSWAELVCLHCLSVTTTHSKFCVHFRISTNTVPVHNTFFSLGGTSNQRFTLITLTLWKNELDIVTSLGL